METYYEELKISIELAYQAGEIALQYCKRENNNSLEIEKKEDESPLTIADKKLNKLITTQLSKKFPNYRVIGEESTCEIKDDLKNGFVFFVDPIGIFNNFTKRWNKRVH